MKTWLYLLFSFVLWLIPFLIGLFVSPDNYRPNTPEIERVGIHLPVKEAELFESIDTRNNFKTFILISKNNLIGCIMNIAGGILIGTSTVFNLMYNGFYSASIARVNYENGMSINTILSLTLPHSFELVGFWASGAIGFYIMLQILRYVFGKKPDEDAMLRVLYSTTIVFLIIISAAFVEAFITSSFLD